MKLKPIKKQDKIQVETQLNLYLSVIMIN